MTHDVDLVALLDEDAIDSLGPANRDPLDSWAICRTLRIPVETPGGTVAIRDRHDDVNMVRARSCESRHADRRAHARSRKVESGGTLAPTVSSGDCAAVRRLRCGDRPNCTITAGAIKFRGIGESWDRAFPVIAEGGEESGRIVGRLVEPEIDVARQPRMAMVDHGLPAHEQVPHAMLLEQRDEGLNVGGEVVGSHERLDIEHYYRESELPALHRDPFDRLLVARAIERDLSIVTPDPAIRAYPVAVVW